MFGKTAFPTTAVVSAKTAFPTTAAVSGTVLKTDFGIIDHICRGFKIIKLKYTR